MMKNKKKMKSKKLPMIQNEAINQKKKRNKIKNFF